MPLTHQCAGDEMHVITDFFKHNYPLMCYIIIFWVGEWAIQAWAFRKRRQRMAQWLRHVVNFTIAEAQRRGKWTDKTNCAELLSFERAAWDNMAKLDWWFIADARKHNPFNVEKWSDVEMHWDK